MSNNQDIDQELGPSKTTIFAVRTTIGQEKSVLQNMFNRLRVLNPFPDLKAMMIAEQLRGYVFVEAYHQRDVMIAVSGLKHVKGKVVGSIQLDTITHVISPRKVTEILEEGDTVEIVSGIFQGQQAQVIRMPKEGAKEEVTLRLLNSDSAISIKIHGDFLKLIQKGEKRQEQYIIKEIEAISPTSGSAGAANESGAPIVKAIDDQIIPLEGNTPITAAETAPGNEEDVFDFGEEQNDEASGTDSEKFTVDKPKKKRDTEKEAEEEDDEWAKFGF